MVEERFFEERGERNEEINKSTNQKSTNQKSTNQMKRKDPENLGDVLQQYLVAIGADKHIKEVRVTQEWDKIVGPMIARNTSDINLKEGVLTVKFRSPLIRNEISMRRTSLQKIINDAIGEEVVQRIVIR